jgi:hypothetical protein
MRGVVREGWWDKTSTPQVLRALRPGLGRVSGEGVAGLADLICYWQVGDDVLEIHVLWCISVAGKGMRENGQTAYEGVSRRCRGLKIRREINVS